MTVGSVAALRLRMGHPREGHAFISPGSFIICGAERACQMALHDVLLATSGAKRSAVVLATYPPAKQERLVNATGAVLVVGEIVFG